MNSLWQHHLDVALHRDRIVDRRHFLRSISRVGLAAGGLAWTDAIRLRADELRRQGRACILLWMQGGPSQLETFDPKPAHSNGGETKAIDTNVPGLRFADNLPHLAKLANRLAVVRSMTTREGEHQRATHLMHTSYLPLASVQYPAMGAVAAHELRSAACELPAFVRIGGGLQTFANGGFLGNSCDAFMVGSAGRAPENSRPTTDTPRFERRLGLLSRLQMAADSNDSADHRQLYDDASRMILSAQMEAFDLEREPASLREAYGLNRQTIAGMRTGSSGPQFGAACLLARRLVEAGVTFVELGLPGWDTHDDNFNRSRTLCGQFDQPVATLLADLEERGLLEKTLIVWLGEFGRTPRINPRGGRDHWPRAFSAVLAGGGIRGGQVVGATDEGGESITDRPVTEKDLFQTVYKVLGVDARKEQMSPIGRPIKFVDGGEPVRELLG